MHITPEMAEATYELLRTTKPFKGWKLPPGEAVEFWITKHHGLYGQHSMRDAAKQKLHIIEISCSTNTHLETLIKTMAHEMCHLYQRMRGFRDMHGANFKRIAHAVCKAHHFDEGAF